MIKERMAWRNEPVVLTTMVKISGANHDVPWLQTSNKPKNVASLPRGIIWANMERARAVAPPRANPITTPMTTASALLSNMA